MSLEGPALFRDPRAQFDDAVSAYGGLQEGMPAGPTGSRLSGRFDRTVRPKMNLEPSPEQMKAEINGAMRARQLKADILQGRINQLTQKIEAAKQASADPEIIARLARQRSGYRITLGNIRPDLP